MAKKSKIAADRRRREVVARYAQRRAELKRVVAPGSTVDEWEAATRELRRQPRDASASRLRNRDAVDGRPRGYPRAFGVSRVRLRELAHGGCLPGVRKSSW